MDEGKRREEKKRKGKEEKLENEKRILVIIYLNEY